MKIAIRQKLDTWTIIQCGPTEILPLAGKSARGLDAFLPGYGNETSSSGDSCDRSTICIVNLKKGELKVELNPFPAAAHDEFALRT